MHCFKPLIRLFAEVRAPSTSHTRSVMSFIDQRFIVAAPATERGNPQVRLAALAAVCLLAAFSASCSKEEERPVVAQPVRLFVLQDGHEAPFRSFPGEVVSPRTGRLSFEVSGRLIEFPIQNGQLVKKGELIGQLDTADFIAARDSAQASFDAAKSNFERNQALQQRGAVAIAVVDRARQELDMADASLRTALRALDETRLLAPFDGRIAERIARELQNVRAQEQVAILEDISSLEIEINIPERDMMIGSRGLTVDEAREMLEAKVEFSSMPDQRLDLDLKTFSTRANPVSRTFLVSFAFEPPPDQNILPGMTGSVLIRRTPETAADAAGDKAVRMVPVEAITTHSGASTIWRLDPESMTVSAVPVEISSIKGGAALIRAEQLANGDEIVASGARFLAEGTPVSRMEPRKP
jgi:multidrug efflux system membrane fusion protein